MATAVAPAVPLSETQQSTALALAVTAPPPVTGMTPEQEQRFHAAVRDKMLAALAAEGRDRIARPRRTFTSRARAVVVRLVRATRTARTATSRRTASHTSTTRTASTAGDGGEPGEPAGPPRSLAEVERSPREGNRKQPTPAPPEVMA